MNERGAFGLPARLSRQATLAGILIGIVYTLSPFTVWFAIGIVPVVYYATRGLDPDERRWITRLLVAAVALRLLAVAALFLLTDHSRVAFGSFFLDEEYFIERSLWLRNLALGIPLHRDDLVSALDPISASSHLYLLALIQILIGPAPYGLHLLGVLCYLAAAIALYRMVRPTLGRMPALIGLAILLFLPSQFAWSVSTLKEPLFVLLGALNLVLAVRLVRAATWKGRAVSLAAMVVSAAGLESVRHGGAILSALGLFTGLTIALLAERPRLMLGAIVATPILLGTVLSRPDVQLRLYTGIQSAARLHWGSVAVSRGYAYETLDERFYASLPETSDLQFAETLRFMVRAIVAYVVVPLPWKAQSRAALAYLPEQVAWYLLAALAPLGFLFAFRRDALVSALLMGHLMVIGLTVALVSGNVGTLVRHRGLALPYLVWLSAVGGCELLSRSALRSA